MDSMKILDTRHTCQNCRFNDGMAYTSNPVKYKCTFDGNFYEGLHPCHLDLAPVIRCKECKLWEKIESSLLGEVMCCTGQGDVKIQKAADDFCSYGERRSE